MSGGFGDNLVLLCSGKHCRGLCSLLRVSNAVGWGCLSGRGEGSMQHREARMPILLKNILRSIRHHDQGHSPAILECVYSCSRQATTRE